MYFNIDSDSVTTFWRRCDEMVHIMTAVLLFTLGCALVFFVSVEGDELSSKLYRSPLAGVGMIIGAIALLVVIWRYVVSLRECDHASSIVDARGSLAKALTLTAPSTNRGEAVRITFSVSDLTMTITRPAAGSDETTPPYQIRITREHASPEVWMVMPTSIVRQASDGTWRPLSLNDVSLVQNVADGIKSLHGIGTAAGTHDR